MTTSPTEFIKRFRAKSGLVAWCEFPRHPHPEPWPMWTRPVVTLKKQRLGQTRVAKQMAKPITKGGCR